MARPKNGAVRQGPITLPFYEQTNAYTNMNTEKVVVVLTSALNVAPIAMPIPSVDNATELLIITYMTYRQSSLGNPDK